MAFIRVKHKRHAKCTGDLTVSWRRNKGYADRICFSMSDRLAERLGVEHGSYMDLHVDVGRGFARLAKPKQPDEFSQRCSGNKGRLCVQWPVHALPGQWRRGPLTEVRVVELTEDVVVFAIPREGGAE